MFYKITAKNSLFTDTQIPDMDQTQPLGAMDFLGIDDDDEDAALNSLARRLFHIYKNDENALVHLVASTHIPLNGGSPIYPNASPETYGIGTTTYRAWVKLLEDKSNEMKKHFVTLLQTKYAKKPETLIQMVYNKLELPYVADITTLKPLFGVRAKVNGATHKAFAEFKIVAPKEKEKYLNFKNLMADKYQIAEDKNTKIVMTEKLFNFLDSVEKLEYEKLLLEYHEEFEKEIKGKNEIAKGFRKFAIENMVAKTKSLYNDLHARENISKVHFCLIAEYHGNPQAYTKIDDGNFYAKHGEKAKEIFNTIRNSIGSAQLFGLNNSNQASTFWSETNDVVEHPMPIKIWEILQRADLNIADFRYNPYREMNYLTYKNVETDPSLGKQDSSLKKIKRKNAALLLARSIAEENIDATEEGGARLLKIIKCKNLSELQNYSQRMIYYLFFQECEGIIGVESSKSNSFKNLLSESGYSNLIPSLSQNVPEDKLCEDLGLYFGSGEEQRCIEMFRERYGLPAIPYRLGIPSVVECPTNPRGFVVDFVVPSDIVVKWDKLDDSDNMLHPFIQSTVCFVGEYFGFNSDKPVTLNKDYLQPNGEVMKTSSGIEMKKNTTVTIGDIYKTRTEWKKVIETFAAISVGGDVIFVDKDMRDNVIAPQLDRKHIIYKNMTNNYEQSLKAIQKHASNCNKQNICEGCLYLNKKNNLNIIQKYQIAYVNCAIADYKIQKNVLQGIQNLNSTDFNINLLYDFYVLKNHLEQEIYALYNILINEPENKQIRLKYYSLIKQKESLMHSQFEELQKEINLISQKDISFQEGLNKLNNLLLDIESNKQLSGKELLNTVNQIVMPVEFSSKIKDE